MYISAVHYVTFPINVQGAQYLEINQLHRCMCKNVMFGVRWIMGSFSSPFDFREVYQVTTLYTWSYRNLSERFF